MTFLETIQNLIRKGSVRVSEHGYEELSNDDIFVKDAVDGIVDAIVIEEYPEYPKGHCVLVLEYDRFEKPFHVVWGMPKGNGEPAVLITAYRPDPNVWEDRFTRRKK